MNILGLHSQGEQLSSKLSRFTRAMCIVGLPFVLLLISSGCLVSTEHQINYGLNHFNMGLYNQAIPALVNAANSLEKTNPPDPRLPQILVALGDMANSEGRNDLAEGFYKRALNSAEHLAKPNNTLLRNSLVHGGNFYLNIDRPAEGLPLLQRAVAISETNPEFPRTLYAIDLDNLGQAYYRLNRHPEGRALSVQALSVLGHAKSEPEALKARGIVFYNLAMSYKDLNENAEAEANFRNSLEILSPSTGHKAGSPSEIRVLITAYANFLRKLGRGDDAKQIEARIEQSIHP